MKILQNQNKDILGYDPWGLRKVSSAKQVLPLSWENLVSQSRTRFLDDPQLDLKKDIIPKIIYFIWIGSYFDRESRRKIVSEWAKLNPDYKVTLWILPTEKNDDKELELTIWAKNNGIFLFFVEDVLNGNMPVMVANCKTVNLEVLFRNENSSF